MEPNGHMFVSALILLFVLPLAESVADIAPPVKITMPPDTRVARTGEMYDATFEILVGAAGRLSNLEISGEGWDVLEITAPSNEHTVEPGRVEIPFRAIPKDADRPIGLQFLYNGQRVKKSFVVGPAYFSNVGKDRPLIQLTPMTTGGEFTSVDGSPVTASGGAVPLEFRGRLVYTRQDGEIVGVDNIHVEVMDDDGLSSDELVDEEIWSGLTDENGYFNSPVIMWDDCDATGCDVPDLYVRFKCYTGIAQVQESGILEEDYSWSTSDSILENHGGSPVEFGTVTADADAGAAHIWNSIVRAHRYIFEATGIFLPMVDVQWPDEGGTVYNPFFEEIHISQENTWDEWAHNHEYGHHFSETQAYNPPGDYCNGYCDDGACVAGEDCPNDGHCPWCPESAENAFNEAVSQWLGDAIPRDYPNRYVFDCGSPYEAMNRRNYDRFGTCCQDQQLHDPLTTEGPIAMFLRDIEDADLNDHDDDPDIFATSYDGVRDMMCMGPGPILQLIATQEPHTVSEFISMFLSVYPEDTDLFWPTAFNVGGAAYVSDFPNDAALPGVVPSCDSSTHPIGQGGPGDTIVFEFEPARDDVRGASYYAFALTQDPAGTMPFPIDGVIKTADGCTLSGELEANSLGDHYISIRAQDNFGNWSDQYAVFGPFTITDCNDTGLMGACDIVCGFFGDPSFCEGGQEPCGMSDDCNANWIPDECDVASGLSSDCNRNEVPDECESLLYWIGSSGSFGDPDNWHNPEDCIPPTTPADCPEDQYCWAIPGDNSNVCIANDELPLTITYDGGAINLGTLACEESFVINGQPSPTPELTLQDASWIDGGLTFGGHANSELWVQETLTIGGTFHWTSPTHLHGAGTTILNGGFLADFAGSVNVHSHDIILTNSSNADAQANVYLIGNSLFQVDEGSRYDFEANGSVFSGMGEFRNYGLFRRLSGDQTASIGCYIENVGEVRAHTGTLSFTRGGSSTGSFVGMPGAILDFGTGQQFGPSSSIQAESVVFGFSGFGDETTVHGTYDVSGETLVAGSNVVFDVDADIVNFGDTFTIRDNRRATIRTTTRNETDIEYLNMNSGFMGLEAADTLVIQDFDFGGSESQMLGSGNVVVNGAMNYMGGADMLFGGLLTLNGSLIVHPTSSSRQFDRNLNNSGHIEMFGHLGFTGSRTFNNFPTGVVEIKSDVTAFSFGTAQINNDGLIIKNAGVGEAGIGIRITNRGVIEVASGQLRFDHPLNQLDGETYLSGGDIVTGSGGFQGPFRIKKGLIRGQGGVVGDLEVSGCDTPPCLGRISPGNSIGTMTVTGDLLLEEDAVFAVELSGLTPETEHDQLFVGGTATLDGNLVIDLVNGYVPEIGDSFVILVSTALAGDPFSVTGPGEWDVNYQNNGVTITLISAPCGIQHSSDVDYDCDVDLNDHAALVGCLGGPASTVSDFCLAADITDDGMVDMRDFSNLQRCFGDTNDPACPD
ncbi:MAG: hypothetical protein ACYTHJ_14875 [Planctomycetota bacterium]|jgi:hypothetical protein